MASDARISTGLPGHPKTKKLIKRLGPAAGWHLVCLFLWTADNRSDGDLTGMNDEDIELAIDWPGDNGAFVRELMAVGFLDGVEGARAIHDWEEHNPWAAGSAKRSEKSKFAALCKRYGRSEAIRMMPAPANPVPVAKENDAKGMPLEDDIADQALPDIAPGMPQADSGSAPSPIPSPSPLPSPSPNPNTPQPPTGGRRGAIDPDEEPEGFGVWYAVYRRKDAKRDAIKAWRQLAPDDLLQAVMLSALARWKWSDDRQKIPLPASWLRGRRWEDESVARAGPTQGPSWWLEAGFTHIAEAQNARCHIGNYREFRDGVRIVEDTHA